MICGKAVTWKAALQVYEGRGKSFYESIVVNCANGVLFLMCRGDLVEAAFQANLVEDKSSAGPSYVDYLCTVHRHIQERNR